MATKKHVVIPDPAPAYIPVTEEPNNDPVEQSPIAEANSEVLMEISNLLGPNGSSILSGNAQRIRELVRELQVRDI